MSKKKMREALIAIRDFDNANTAVEIAAWASETGISSPSVISAQVHYETVKALKEIARAALED